MKYFCYRLRIGFRLPDEIKLSGSKFSSEEVILIVLMRFAFPFRWSDLYTYFPGRDHSQLSRATYWFLEFMILHWGYLLLNNLQFWLPKFPAFAEAMRIKLATLPNEDNRQYFPSAYDRAGGFCAMGAIDNTLNATCRPGGPRTGGEQAPRWDRLIQQAWWTGWKKLHGIKWQTLDLPNGMNLHVWGPASVRRNDNFTLGKSNILEKLRILQAGQPLKFKIIGDSAYSDDDIIATGGGRGMSAIREQIEWNYKDLKMLWKYLDYKHVLKLRKQPVAKIVFVCMLLRNAHCSIYGNESSEYFNITPPSFEEWLSQGPDALPIPNDIIWSRTPEP
jgi:hypothetical protein